MAEDDSNRDFQVHFVRPMIGVAVLAVFVGILPLLTGVGPWLGDENIKRRLEMLGTFGDMFGFLNATFSGVAFCAIYYTLRIQQKQHDLQLRDLNMRREIAKLVVDKETSEEVIEASVPFGNKEEGKTRPQCPA